MITQVSLNKDQQAMLSGSHGPAKQMAMRLLLDMAAAAGATELVSIQSAHLSGVSPLTGGLGLRRLLARLTEDPDAQVAVPTTLNAAGCDAVRFEAMHIVVPGFKEQSEEIVAHYAQLGVRPTQSCIPYEWDGVAKHGRAAWAESNAICFGNSYCGLVTNRESGLSALASALTGYAPRYGLFDEEARRPNLEVIVDCSLKDPTDFSILGDWIGKQRQPHWRMPFGPIPLLKHLPQELDHEQRKALAAAAANYGTPLLYIEGSGKIPEPAPFQATLTFTEAELERRYTELLPRSAVSLVAIGCPQASIGEIRSVAELLRGRKVSSDPYDESGLPPLWIFTSSANRTIAERIGLAEIIAESGALLLENTCPEVVPYDPSWVRHILTNSMKAEHYLKSGLNSIPTSVMRLADCVAIAAGDRPLLGANRGEIGLSDKPSSPSPDLRRTSAPSPSDQVQPRRKAPHFEARGRGLPSQDEFIVAGEAFVTNVPITFLGFVNRETGEIQEPGHPADGQSMAAKIAIFPKGSGSTVAPYVLLELFYRDMAPVAIVNTEIDQQSAPACSLEGIPYAYDFDASILDAIKSGDMVELARSGEEVKLRLVVPSNPATDQLHS